jgi:hypothetical protein
MFGGNSIFNSTEDAVAHFNISSDSIMLPAYTYNSVVKTLMADIPSLICNTATYSGCYYNNVCSTIMNNFGPLVFQFGDQYTFSVPYWNDEMDGNNFYCYIKIKPQPAGKQNIVDIGAPFFQGF